MRGTCSKCGEKREVVVIGLLPGEEEVKRFCKQCAEEEGYIKPYPQVETKERKKEDESQTDQ